MAKYQGTLSVKDSHQNSVTEVLFETAADPERALQLIAQYYYAAIGLEEASGEFYFPEVGMTVKPIAVASVTDEAFEALSATLHVVPVPFDIEAGLGRVREAFGAERFEDGECHILAMALLRAMGTGKLYACMRETLNEDGSVYSVGYSHMVYECPKSELWDIRGIEADVRWEERFPDMDVPDKWGMTSRFNWVEVPHTLPDLGDVQQWLLEHSGTIDWTRTMQVLRTLQGNF